MKFEIIDEYTRADAAFRAYGNDLNELFAAGARAVMSVMVENIELIDREIEKSIYLENNELTALLHEFLQEFIFFKDSASLLLIADTVEVDYRTDTCKLKCRAYGETIKRDKHEFNVDVKAVTMHRLNVERKDKTWIATVILDV